MSTARFAPPRDALEWAYAELLRPALHDALADGAARRPQDWGDDAAYAGATVDLFAAQEAAIAAGVPATRQLLKNPSGMSSTELDHALASIDWVRLGDSLRLRSTSRGRLEMTDSVVVVRSVPKECHGPNIFATNAPAMPKRVQRCLAAEGHDLGRAEPDNARGYDSSIYAVEIAPEWALAMRVEPNPAGTWFDLARYPLAWRSAAAAVLQARYGEYSCDPLEIVRENILRSLSESITAHGRTGELPLPLESGQLRGGVRADEYSYCGGDVATIVLASRYGMSPFMDLPRALVRSVPRRGRSRTAEPDGRVRFHGERCGFLLPDGRELSSKEISWAAAGAFGDVKVPPKLENVFDPIDLPPGAVGPDVEYAVAEAAVGRPTAPRSRRIRIALLMRSDGGVMSGGWGVRGCDMNDPAAQREVIEHAEQHLERMRPDGDFDRLVEHLQAVGMQGMQLERPEKRAQREGLLRAAHVLRTRAALYR